MYVVHCIQYNIYSTLYTVHCIHTLVYKYTCTSILAYNILYTVHYIQYIVYITYIHIYNRRKIMSIIAHTLQRLRLGRLLDKVGQGVTM